MNKPELLAPAGNRAALEAAIKAGADAVYLGLQRFGARSYADNFSRDQINEAINYAHQYGVKVYATLNIIILPQELDDALDDALFLAKAGIDGVLIQDFGLALLLRKRLPQLALHASTQMYIHNLESVKLLENLGFTRVVLARETEYQQVLSLAKEPIETEIFVYGALCVCYSGQCYLSSENGNRSGNRGSCAQPCRLPYKLLQDGNQVVTPGEYLLSPKDLYTIDRVSALLSLSADCWKIEGRMKRPEYVAFITKQYRQAIDAASNHEAFTPDQKDAALLFNRGFTSGHIFSSRGLDLMNPERPNHQGILLGHVVEKNSSQITILLQESLHQGDGLRILGQPDQGLVANKIYLKGKLVNSANSHEKVSFDYDLPVKVGSEVRLTSSSLQLTSLDKLPPRYEAVELSVKAKVGMPLRMTATYKSIVLVMSDIIKLEEAKNHVLTQQEWYDQLGKTKDTPYYFSPIKIDAEKNVFVPVSRINDMRRRILERLQQRLIAKPEITLLDYKFIEYKTITTKSIHVSFQTAEQFEVLKDYKVTLFTSDPTLLVNNPELGMEMPRVNEDQSFPNLKLAYVNEPGEASLLIKRKYASLYLNITNQYAVRFFLDLGCTAVELSSELSDPEIGALIQGYKDIYHCEPNLIYRIYGRKDLMVTKYCAPNTYLSKDQQKHCGLCKLHRFSLQSDKETYPLLFDKDCFQHLLPEKPFDRITDLPSLKALGITNFHLVFTTETAQEVREVMNRLWYKQ